MEVGLRKRSMRGTPCERAQPAKGRLRRPAGSQRPGLCHRLQPGHRHVYYIRNSEYTNIGSRRTMTDLSVSKLCKCLGDDLRLSLVCLMDVQREICVCDLVDALEAPQSTISRHLAQLRQCELVVARRQGTWMHYRLNPELPQWALTVIETLAEPARAQLGLRTPTPVCC